MRGGLATEEDLDAGFADVLPGPTWLWVALALVVAVVGVVTAVWMIRNGTGPVGPAPVPEPFPAN